MDRKPYQEAALATLDRFARQARDQGPHRAFGALAPREPTYRDQGFGATPYVCLRLPTGGGKTVLAADAIPVLRRFAGQDFPLTLWLVPSKAILDQTAATLRDPQHPYRERINAQFGIDRVRVLRQDGRGIRPIALYQAERKDGTMTPATIRAHLRAGLRPGVQGRAPGAPRPTQAPDRPRLAAGDERAGGIPVDWRLGADGPGSEHRRAGAGWVAGRRARLIAPVHAHHINPPAQGKREQGVQRLAVEDGSGGRGG